MSSLPKYSDDVKDSSMGLSPPSHLDREREEIAPAKMRRLMTKLTCLVIFLYFGIHPLLSFMLPEGIHLRDRIPCHTQQNTADAVGHVLVPLEAHIMSKCPDAQDCLKMLVLPTMQRVFDKVNFTLSSIGTPTDNDGVACMHGPEECMGNIIELCAAKLYPSPKSYLGFTMCLTRDYHSIPQKSLVEDCALEHGLDFEKLNECTTEDNGGTGVGLLRDSVRRSTDAGVTKSCTIRLNEEIYCVRDNGEWKECPAGPGVNDLVISIEKQYRSSAARISPSIAH